MKTWRMLCVTKNCLCSLRNDFEPCAINGITERNVLQDAQGFWPCPQDKKSIGVLQHLVGGRWVEVQHDESR
jgi:hypothetical protein